MSSRGYKSGANREQTMWLPPSISDKSFHKGQIHRFAPTLNIRSVVFQAGLRIHYVLELWHQF